MPGLVIPSHVCLRSTLIDLTTNSRGSFNSGTPVPGNNRTEVSVNGFITADHRGAVPPALNARGSRLVPTGASDGDVFFTHSPSPAWVALQMSRTCSLVSSIVAKYRSVVSRLL